MPVQTTILAALTLTALALLIRSWLATRNNTRLIAISLGIVAAAAAGAIALGSHRNSLLNAIRSGDSNRVSALLASQPNAICEKSLLGDTPLHFAVASGDTNTVAILLVAGADPNAPGDSRATPLHVAAFGGSAVPRSVLMLLHAGANVNARGYRHNETPLHVAAAQGHAEVVKLLLANGADAGAENMLGKTPAELAQARHQTNVLAAFAEGNPH